MSLESDFSHESDDCEVCRESTLSLMRLDVSLLLYFFLYLIFLCYFLTFVIKMYNHFIHYSAILVIGCHFSLVNMHFHDCLCFFVNFKV